MYRLPKMKIPGMKKISGRGLQAKTGDQLRKIVEPNLKCLRPKREI